MSAHTPGPWKVRRQQIVDASGSVVARITDNESSGFDCPTPVVAEANARLIAAAPELLAALKMAQLWLDVDGRYDMQAINAAISKAQGE